MEYLPENFMLEFPPDLLTSVRKLYNLDQPGRMSEAVDILEEWVKKQEHFTKKDFLKSYLESTITASKGSLEVSKSRMDKLCTYRTLWPKFFEVTNMKVEFASVLHIMYFFPLPKLTEDKYRVYLLKLRTTDFEPTDFQKFINVVFIALEYQKRFDYATGVILICDYSTINVSDAISKLSLSEIHQFATVASEGYGVRIKGIVYLTPSRLIEGFIKLMKQFIPEKIGNRLQVSKTVDDLYKYVPKEILPEEYGGTAGSSDELYDKYIDIVSSEDHVNHMKEMKNARTDESLRQNDKCNDPCMGIPGTFRSLNVD